MAKFILTSKKAFILFICITILLFAQAVWWVVLMAKLFNEKVNMAIELGATQNYVDIIHQEEISRQIMIGSEGIFFLLLAGIGAWLIYRTLVKNEELQFAQQNFLMSVTHEIKTPLASMKIYLDTLNSDKISEEKKIAIFPRLKNDVTRLEKLVENILEAGRFEKDGYELHKDYFDFIMMIDESVKKFTELYQNKKIEVKTKNFPVAYLFYGDKYALSRAFEAIIENAVKYNDKEKIIIKLSFKSDTKNINLYIIDNGVGLQKEHFDLVFNRFYRVGDVLNISKPGSGLGLFLSKEVMKAHQGKIEIDSDGIGLGVEINLQLKVLKNYENNSLS